ncbi:MAG: ABC transporter substrate-binding protein [Actinobacteria bacterium]|nr:ABC transporter substrate-binding protein [Actinomycetota bacterium]
MAACGGGSEESGGSSSGGSGSTSLKIGDVVALTGPAAEFGPSWDKAAKIAVEEGNAAAKEAGLSFNADISAADEGSSPQTAVAATRKLVAEGSNCVLGGLAFSIPMAEGVTIPGEVPQITPATTSPLYSELHAKGGFTFRTIPSDAFGDQMLADYLVNVLGGAKGKLISVAARDDSYGAPAAEAFVEAWQERGGETQGPVLYNPNATSYDAEAAKIVANNPAAFVIFDEPGTYAKVGAALLRTGSFDASKLYSTSGFPSEIPPGTPPAALEGAHFVNPGVPPGGKALEGFEKAFASSSLEPKKMQPYSQNNYDGAVICMLAAAAAKSSEGSAIAKQIPEVTKKGAPEFTYGQLRQAFEAIKAGKPIFYNALSGSTPFDENGDPTSTIAAVTEYKNGKLVQVGQLELTAGGKLIEK